MIIVSNACDISFKRFASVLMLMDFYKLFLIYFAEITRFSCFF